MAPTSSTDKPKKLPKPLPAHRCGSRVCCNFIVPPTRAKYKYQFCSDECGKAQRRYEWHFTTCRTCPAEIKREANRYYCEACETKRQARSAALIASGKVPRKPCAWVFCQKEYQPRSNGQKYCSDNCRKGAATGGQPSGAGYPTAMPSERTEYSFCTGNCGRSHYVGWERHSYNRLCRGCSLGRKYGTLRPFGTPLPAGWERCHWVFCNALFQPENRQQRGCCSLHEKMPSAGAEGWPTHRSRGYASHKCANNCGSVLYATSQSVCLPCVLGLRYGRVNPFPDDAQERARWGEQVVHLTKNQLAAEWDYLRPPVPVPVPVAAAPDDDDEWLVADWAGGEVFDGEDEWMNGPVLHTCGWAFCGQAFTPTPGGEYRYCSPACRRYDDGGTLRYTRGHTSPNSGTEVLCEGGCGLWMPGPVGHLYQDICFPCFVGKRYGKRNPYPPVPADRTAASYYLSQTQLTAELNWLDTPSGTKASSPPADEWLGLDEDWEWARQDETEKLPELLGFDYEYQIGQFWFSSPLKKRCEWVFCGEPFVQWAKEIHHCSPACFMHSRKKWHGMPIGVGWAYPKARTDVLCAGGCGVWLQGGLLERCFACENGLRHGKRNPYPPMPADRTAARYYLSQDQLAAELNWLLPEPVRRAAVPGAVAILGALASVIAGGLFAWWVAASGL